MMRHCECGDMDGGEPCRGVVDEDAVRVRYLPREHRPSADALGAETLAARVYWTTYTLHPECAEVVLDWHAERAPGRAEVV